MVGSVVRSNDDVLQINFVAPVDDDLAEVSVIPMWGVVLTQQEECTFVAVGDRQEFVAFLEKLEDPLMLLVNAVYGGDNTMSFEFLDRVLSEEENFILNGQWFNHNDLRRAIGQCGVE